MVETAPTFKCVPFDASWAIAGTKYDLKAIYRRPRRTTDEYDQITAATNAEGRQLWDLTSPLPLRRHSDWVAKGFEYVTLADLESLEKAAASLRRNGLRVQDFLQHPQLGPWNPKLYAATADASDRSQFQDLLALVEQFGVQTVEEIRGQPLPAALKQQLAAKAVAAGKSPPSTPPTSDATEATEAPSTAPAAPRRAAAAKKKKAKPGAEVPA